MNNWNFTGNIGNDAEQRFITSGDSVVQFSVAVKSGFGKKAATTWARCAMWGKRGEAVLPYLKKGQLVGVTGEAALREYEKDGVTRSSLEVRVNDLTLLGKRDDDAPASGTYTPRATYAAPKASTPAPAFDDDIPF